MSEKNETKTLGIASVQEFGVYNTSKYIRETVNIDRSSENIKDLSDEGSPIFKGEELFLSVLVKGKATLYLYRACIQVINSAIEQVFFYKTADNKKHSIQATVKKEFNMFSY